MVTMVISAICVLGFCSIDLARYVPSSGNQIFSIYSIYSITVVSYFVVEIPTGHLQVRCRRERRPVELTDQIPCHDTPLTTEEGSVEFINRSINS